MIQILIVTILMLLAAPTLQAGYSIDVKKATDFPAGVGIVAILPSSCPPDVDSIWLDRKVEKEMARYGQIKIISARKVKQTMFDMGIECVSSAPLGLVAALGK